MNVHMAKIILVGNKAVSIGVRAIAPKLLFKCTAGLWGV